MRTEAEVTANITRWNTVALRKLLEAKLDEEDLRNYVFELAIDYDDLRGATIADKVRELVSYLDHHDQLDELVALTQKYRPDIDIKAFLFAEVPIPRVNQEVLQEVIKFRFSRDELYVLIWDLELDYEYFSKSNLEKSTIIRYLIDDLAGLQQFEHLVEWMQKLRPDINTQEFLFTPAEGYLLRGAYYAYKQDYDSAIADYNQAIEMNPGFVEAYQGRGLAYQLKGAHDQAIRDFDQVIQLKPDDGVAYFDRAVSYRSQGMQVKAVADFRKAISLSREPAIWRQAREQLKALGALGGRDFEMDSLEVYRQDRNRWAVVVGISTYQNPRLNLNYAHRDAEELCALLQTPQGGNFEPRHVRKLINEEATTNNIVRALRSFLQRPAKEDLVLIYFACHGAADPDRPNNLYLLTYDTEPADIAGTALPMREIDQTIRDNVLAERIVIIADTCHSAGIGGGIGRRSSPKDSDAINRYLQSLSETRPGVAMLTASEAAEVSREGEQWGGGHGVFTYYLLEGMRGKAANADGIVTLGQLFEYVRDNVKQDTHDTQHPAVGTGEYDRNLPMAAVTYNGSET